MPSVKRFLKIVSGRRSPRFPYNTPLLQCAKVRNAIPKNLVMQRMT